MFAPLLSISAWPRRAVGERMLGSGEGSGDGGGYVGQGEAAVAVVRCAGLPGQFAVVGESDDATAGQSWVCGDQDGAGAAANVGEDGVETVAVQGVAGDVLERRVAVRVADGVWPRTVRVEEPDD